MSSDPQILAALAMKTGQEMRYFELVKASCGDQSWTCFMCLGKHAVFFMRQDLNGKIHDGWELFYAYVMKVVLDSNTSKAMMFVLNDNKSPKWKSDRLFIKSENRELLLKHLRCNWQTDHMWRVKRVKVFPVSKHPITKDKVEPSVEPFLKHRWARYNHYRHMLPMDFEDQPNSIQAHGTGEYINRDGVSLVMHVHEALTLDQLVHLRREHIRWVAAEYKVQLVREEGQVFYVSRNQPRQKRMNLTGDIAAWHGWELAIRTQHATLICLLLRRQFIPPVCNTAQDIAVIMRVPASAPNFGELLLEAHLIADSVCPDATPVAPYRDIVQAKADALRFDEESFDWIRAHLKIDSKWRSYALAFVKAMVKIFVDAGQLERSVLDSAIKLESQEEDDEDDAGSEPKRARSADIDGIIREMQDNQEGGGVSEASGAGNEVKNRWIARVARYFVWAVDGGVLQSKFTLAIMFDRVMLLGDSDFKKILQAQLFMLHMRPVDWKKPYIEVPLVQQIKTDLRDWKFSDRVMQSVISQEYLRKRLGRHNESDYFVCLAHLLESNAGTSLKAYVCRIFMEMRNEGGAAHRHDEVNLKVVPTLIELLKSGGVFLCTYASAALVNLSDGNDAVKMMLMSHNAAGLAIQNVKSKDDELISYTLMLLVNLTKQPHHRSVIANGGLLPLLYDLLTSSYHQCDTRVSGGRRVSSVSVAGGATKERLLTQVSIIIGHFSIDEAYREQFLDGHQYPHTVKCLLYMFHHSAPVGSLRCKVMFALKQLCKDHGIQKQNVGSHVIKPLVKNLKDEKFEKSTEFLFQVVLLLQMLATHPTNCEIMYDQGLEEILPRTRLLPASRRIREFDERVDKLVFVIGKAALTRGGLAV